MAWAGLGSSHLCHEGGGEAAQSLGREEGQTDRQTRLERAGCPEATFPLLDLLLPTFANSSGWVAGPKGAPTPPSPSLIPSFFPLPPFGKISFWASTLELGRFPFHFLPKLQEAVVCVSVYVRRSFCLAGSRHKVAKPRRSSPKIRLEMLPCLHGVGLQKTPALRGSRMEK